MVVDPTAQALHPRALLLGLELAVLVRPGRIGGAAVGDIETESLLLIAADESPNGSALLIATHEQTDSLALIGLEPLGRGEEEG